MSRPIICAAPLAGETSTFPPGSPRSKRCRSRARLQALRDFGARLGVAEDWLERRQFNNMSAVEIAEAGRRGLDIQLHTHRHIDVKTRVDELPVELADNRAFLYAATGERRFEHFCYPSGRFHPRAPELLAASGVRSATTAERGPNAP